MTFSKHHVYSSSYISGEVITPPQFNFVTFFCFLPFQSLCSSPGFQVFSADETSATIPRSESQQIEIANQPTWIPLNFMINLYGIITYMVNV